MPVSPLAPTAVPNTAEPLVSVTGLRVAYGSRTVLEDVNLTVHPGEIVTLIGPNGAGKTSLVRAVLGLVRPEAGTVWKRPGLRIGYMPQKLTIEEALPLTVRRFLSLWGEVSERQIEAALAEVGAAHIRDRFVQTLSGGEFQRAMLARALVRRPDLLVLDEPAQAIDLHGQEVLFSLIEHIRAVHGCAVLMVSHDLHLVMARTDTVVCLNRHVCCQGHPEAVGQDPEYRRMFGQAAAAFAVYRHHHDHEDDDGDAPHCALDAATSGETIHE